MNDMLNTGNYFIWFQAITFLYYQFIFRDNKDYNVFSRRIVFTKNYAYGY
jgi:hypothetical protein